MDMLISVPSTFVLLTLDTLCTHDYLFKNSGRGPGKWFILGRKAPTTKPATSSSVPGWHVAEGEK